MLLHRLGALPEQPLAHRLGVVGQEFVRGLGLEEFAVMARAVLLVGVFLQRAPERQWMRTRQDGERRQSFGIAVRHTPRYLPAPVVTDKVEALAGRAPQ